MTEIPASLADLDGRDQPDAAPVSVDPDDPLAPIKEAIKEAGDEDLVPGKVAAAVAAMAASGMDAPTRVTVRHYIKKNKLLPVPDFDDIVSSATPLNGPHTRTPGADQPKQVCAPDGVCGAHPTLATAPDLLARVVGTVHGLGVSGEARIIRATYLTVVSQVLPEPVSLVVKGTSAGGKSYSTKTTLRLFPESDMYAVTAGSQRSLIYTSEEFDHRTIVMFEATALREVAEKRDGDMTAMIVRTLMSEGRLVYDVTEKDETGRMTARRITKLGPTNLIITTTADNLHQENETRLLSLSVDESEDQTRRVMRSTAARRYGPEAADAPDLQAWHDLFHWIKYHGEHRVFVPYADYLSENVAATTVRMRRDFNTLLGMIEAHAVAHQLTRDADDYGRIVASAADYDAARGILAEAFAVSSGRKVKEGVRRAVMAVGELGGQAGAEGRDVTVAQVAKHMKRDRTRATRGLKEAVDLGYLVNKEDRPGRAALYRLGAEQLPADTPALPERLPEDACARTPAQLAQVSQQVSDGCAPVRGVRGGAERESKQCDSHSGDSGAGELTRACPDCGEGEDSTFHAMCCLGQDPAA
jgi:hypothetical protein